MINISYQANKTLKSLQTILGGSFIRIDRINEHLPVSFLFEEKLENFDVFEIKDGLKFIYSNSIVQFLNDAVIDFDASSESFIIKLSEDFYEFNR